jgi:hypothetical protein
MAPWTGLTIIWALSMIPLVFFTTLYYADRFSNRKALERQQQRAHEQMLMQRIQDPVQAVAQHVVDTTPEMEPPRVEYDNDESLWDALGVNPLEDQAPGMDPETGVVR